MRIEKEKHKVTIACEDGSLIKGTIHINPGERISDFINNRQVNFIPITDAEVHYSQKMRFLKLGDKSNKTTIILNKSAIRWLRED